jgi:Zn-dependent protease with chaperone function
VRWVVAAALLFVATLIAAYRYAVPAIAVVAANQVPAAIVDIISRQVMTALDTQIFEPTTVSSDRQARLVERFHRVRFPAADPSVTFEVTFRKSDALGPNAVALPSGTIVVTDALVALAQSDEELVAVLAHEAGHVARRHGLRQLFQNSLVALAVTWLVGDVSAIVAAAPTALLQAKYSRDLEREADSYALVALRVNGIPTEHFAVMLERLEHSAEDRGGIRAGALDYLSSHPVTSERIERVRQTH